MDHTLKRKAVYGDPVSVFSGTLRECRKEMRLRVENDLWAMANHCYADQIDHDTIVIRSCGAVIVMEFWIVKGCEEANR